MALSFSIFYFLCSGQGLLLAAIPLKKSDRSTSGILFSIFIFLVTLQMLSYGLAYSRLLIFAPHLWGISTIVFFILPPLFFLAFQSRIEKKTLTWQSFAHFLPALLVLLLRRDFLFRPAAAKIQQLQALSDFVPTLNTSTAILSLIGGIQLIGYALASYDLLKNSSTQQINLSFERKAFYLFLAFTAFYIIYKISIFSGFGYYSLTCHACKSLMGLSIYVMAYTLFVSNPFKTNTKYENSNLSIGLTESLKAKLVELFTRKEIFKDNELNLDKLASILNCSKHDLSQFINASYGKSLPSFINDHRIKYAAERIRNDPASKLWQIGIDAGFNNRVSFNQAFKKIYKTSPSAYRAKVFEEV